MPDSLAGYLFCYAVGSHFMFFKRIGALDFNLTVALLAGLPSLFLVGMWQLEFLNLQPSIIFKCYLEFYAFLSLSIISYRLSPFHRLYSFPGPLICRVTKLWVAYIAYSGQYHRYLKELHDTYGDFVRVGPEEVSVGNADGVLDVLGAAGLPKGRYYDYIKNKKGPKSLNVLPPEEHAKRRRLWNRGMSSESLAEYEGMIARRATQLMDKISKENGPINMIKWLDYFSFDFVGDMAFGGGFELLEAGCDRDGIVKIMEDSMVIGMIIAHLPWIGRSLGLLPFFFRRMYKLRIFGTKVATARVENGSGTKDLWYHLTDEAGLEKETPSKANAISDGALAINAGADTTARAIAFLIFLLLDNPSCMERVKAEIETAFPKGENVLDTSKYASLTYLEACINETLRLYPPVPTNGSRRVPEGSGGHVIAGRYVPEGTEVYVSPYVLHRDSKNFSPRTDEFWPERWLSSSSNMPSGSNSSITRLHDTTAFIPFSFGSQNCVARNLARLEIRMVICLLLSHFEVSLVDHFDKGAWLDSFSDYFVMRATKPLNIVLKEI